MLRLSKTQAQDTRKATRCTTIDGAASLVPTLAQVCFQGL